MGSSDPINEVLRLHRGRRRIPSMLRRHRRSVAATCCAIVVMGVIGFFVSNLPAGAKANLDLEQCANIDTVCDSSHASQWQHGNLNHNQAKYVEGQTVPYRTVIEGLTAGETYSLLIEWDTTQTGKHSIDYLTSFDRTITVADPCAAISCGPLALLGIPVDPNVSGAGVVQPSGQSFSAYGATFPSAGATVTNAGNLCVDASCTIAANPSPYVLTGDYTVSSHTSTTLYFTATTETVVIAWGGHIATRLDWGSDGSAVTISGSPYHMRLHDFRCSDSQSCSSGNMDRSLDSSAVVFGSSISITKQSTRPGSESFGFTAGPSPLADFSLVDDNTSSPTKVFSGITDFTTYTVTEPSIDGWILDSISCAVTSPNGGSQIVNDHSAVIDLREGENVACTFTNSPAPPRSIDLSKTASPTTFQGAGTVITYAYSITNTGSVDLGPTQFTVNDNMIEGGAAFDCGTATATLAVGGTLVCTHDYAITSADVKAGSVTNVATASGAGLTSPQRTATVTLIEVPPTSTTTSTTSTASTTTSMPGSTTTFIAQVTTIPSTSVASSSTTSTTLKPTTTIASTTTSIAPTTTAAPELQAIGIGTTTSVAPETDFLVLYPNELPKTGRSVNWILIIGAAALLIVGSVVGFANGRFNNGSKKKRGAM